MDNRLRLTNATDRPAPTRRRRTPGSGRTHPWRMSDEARRAGQEGIALARRELERARAQFAATQSADAA